MMFWNLVGLRVPKCWPCCGGSRKNKKIQLCLFTKSWRFEFLVRSSSSDSGWHFKANNSCNFLCNGPIAQKVVQISPYCLTVLFHVSHFCGTNNPAAWKFQQRINSQESYDKGGEFQSVCIVHKVCTGFYTVTTSFLHAGMLTTHAGMQIQPHGKDIKQFESCSCSNITCVILHWYQAFNYHMSIENDGPHTKMLPLMFHVAGTRTAIDLWPWNDRCLITPCKQVGQPGVLSFFSLGWPQLKWEMTLGHPQHPIVRCGPNQRESNIYPLEGSCLGYCVIAFFVWIWRAAPALHWSRC